MNEINSHTFALFHYTKEEDTIFKILKEGLKFAYCKEKISDVNCLGIPMISFCDIPIGKSHEHTSKYGSYAIALSKVKLIKEFKDQIAPVNYFISTSHIDAAFKLRKEGLIKKSNFSDAVQKEPGNEVSAVINGAIYKGKAFSKGNSGKFLCDFFTYEDYLRSSSKNISYMKAYQSEYDGKIQINYDECEWRLVYPENKKLLNGSLCTWFWNEKDYNNWRNDRNDKFTDIPNLTFGVNDIEYLIVPTRMEIPSFIKKLMDLWTICHREITEEERFLLVSKVISIEQIKRDF